MKIVCDACSAKYSIADEKVRGKVFKIRCKKCSNIIVVRGSAQEGATAGQKSGTYEQKETKVFNYSGYGDEQDGAGEDAVWHLVIDQEQIGPMTPEEVQARFSRGEIDTESYVWREGFADWERLVDVDVFASWAGAAGDDGGGVGGLFGGGGPIDDPRQNDPADLFVAHGDAVTGGGGGDDGGDLFAGAAMPAEAQSGDGAEARGLFAGGGAGDVMAAASAVKPAALTGQRNENSVLFSLNNLAALASDTPRTSPAPSSSSSSSSSSLPAASPAGGSATGGSALGTEGSGLIDIRSMAQVYLGDNKQQSRPTSGPDNDLPVFSQTSFESASPVLLPTAQPAVNNRLLIALIGLIGVLVIAAVVLVLVVLKGGGKDSDKVAVGDTAATAGEDGIGATESSPGEAPTGAVETPAAAAAGATAAASESAPADEAADGAGASGKPTDAASSGQKGSSNRRRARRANRKPESRVEARSSPPPSPAERPEPAPNPTATIGCDEVTCLVEPDKACCRKYARPSGSSGGGGGSGVDSRLPERPSRAQVTRGIGKVKGRVTSCGARHSGSGRVTVKIKISPNGRVSSANASGGSSALGSCVESAVSRAKFPKTQRGLSVSYPFIF